MKKKALAKDVKNAKRTLTSQKRKVAKCLLKNESLAKKARKSLEEQCRYQNILESKIDKSLAKKARKLAGVKCHDEKILETKTKRGSGQ